MRKQTACEVRAAAQIRGPRYMHVELPVVYEGSGTGHDSCGLGGNALRVGRTCAVMSEIRVGRESTPPFTG